MAGSARNCDIEDCVQATRRGDSWTGGGNVPARTDRRSADSLNVVALRTSGKRKSAGMVIAAVSIAVLLIIIVISTFVISFNPSFDCIDAIL